MNVHDPARFGDGASPIGADLYARHHGNFDAPLNSPRASRTRLIVTGYEGRRLQLRERRRLLYPPVGRQGRMTTGQDGNMVLPRRPAPVRPVDAVEPLPPPVARDQPKSRGVRLRCRPLAPCAPPAGSTGNTPAIVRRAQMRSALGHLAWNFHRRCSNSSTDAKSGGTPLVSGRGGIGGSGGMTGIRRRLLQLVPRRPPPCRKGRRRARRDGGALEMDK